MLIWQISHYTVFVSLEKLYTESSGIYIIPLKFLKAHTCLHYSPICCNWALCCSCGTLLYNSIVSEGQFCTWQKCPIFRTVITVNKLRPFGNVFSVTLTGIISLMSHLGRRWVFTLGEGILNLGLPSLAGMHLTMWKTWEVSEERDAGEPWPSMLLCYLLW